MGSNPAHLLFCGYDPNTQRTGAGMKFPAWYGIVVGVLMIAQWIFSILSGGVPEFQTEPWRIGFHLAAEFCTAMVLILGGIAVLRSAAWGKTVLLIGLGMVIYSEIVSPGYFAQLGQWPMVVMFTALLGGAIGGVLLLLRGNITQEVS
jgi:hypothetical protein